MTHVEGDVNPVRDMEIIHEELRLKDLEYLDKTLDHMERVVIRGGDKSRKAEYVRIHVTLAQSFPAPPAAAVTSRQLSASQHHPRLP